MVENARMIELVVGDALMTVHPDEGGRSAVHLGLLPDGAVGRQGSPRSLRL